MVRGFSILFLFAGIASTFAQQPAPQATAPRWTVLVDPVCPVSGPFQDNAPNTTKEMRVMYFPAAKGAKLKDPQSLTLHAGFNRPGPNSSTVVSFVRKEGFWEALVPLEKFHASYTIFFVRDDKTGAVDDNGGQLWDVVSCLPGGQKSADGVRVQAQSYTGAGWSASIRRPKDYAKAVSILEAALALNPAASGADWGLKEALWEYKAQQGGGDAPAWAKVAGEIGQFATNYQDDKRSVARVSNFIARHVEVLPAEFVERMINLLDSRTDPKLSLRAQVEWEHAALESDSRKSLAAFDAFLAKYPDSSLVVVAQANRLMMLAEMGDLAGAETALAKYREARQHEGRTWDPNAYNLYLTLARLYLDRKTKLDEALKLIDEARETLIPNPAGPVLEASADFTHKIESQCAELRARIYLGLGKPDLAVTEARKAFDNRKAAESYFVLAQALAASGDKQKALDAYFEALLLPSNKDLEYSQELEQFYVKQHFGNRRQFQAALDAKKQAHFQAANYVPQLVDQASPPLEFNTLSGETFNASTLSGKTVIVNFWSPG